MRGYACEWPDCDKTYKKAADLERHVRNHTGELKYTCRVCSKRYARSDVLSRHLVQTHGEPAPTVGRPRKSACVPCAKIRLKRDGVAPTPCPRCLDKQQSCEYRLLRNRRDSNGPPRHELRRGFSSPLRSSETPKSGSAGGLEMCPPSNSVEPVTEMITTLRLAEMHQDFGMPPTSLEYVLKQPYAGSPTDPVPNNELFKLASIASQDDDPLAFLSLDIPIPGVHDWGFADQDFNRFEPLHTTGIRNGSGSWRNSPLADFVVGFGWCGVDPSVPSGLGFGGDEKKWLLDPGTWGPGMDSLHGQPQEIPDGQPDASTWPQIYKPKDRDAGVSLASLSTHFAAAALVPADDHIPETAGGTMRALVEHSHCGICPSVEIGSFASVQALTTSANLYHRHFHKLLLS